MNQVNSKNSFIPTSITKNACDLYNKPNIILHLDYAPDGVKRYIEINRKTHDFNLTQQISNFTETDKESFPNYVLDNINDILEYADSEILKRNIVYIENEKLSGDFYIVDKPLISILPDTLLTQILGRGSKLDLLYQNTPYYGSRNDTRSVQTGAISHFGQKEFQKASKEVERKKYLLISLIDNTINVVSLSNLNVFSNISDINPT